MSGEATHAATTPSARVVVPVGGIYQQPPGVMHIRLGLIAGDAGRTSILIDEYRDPPAPALAHNQPRSAA